MKTSDFHFDLPPELIAQHPVERRDQSRLLVFHRSEGRVEHRRFADLPDYLAAADALVLNETQVLPARLIGRRQPGGGKAELLLVRPLDGGGWLALGRPMRRLGPGEEIEFGDGSLKAIVKERTAEGRVVVDFNGDLNQALERWGEVPLPPYIERSAVENDRQRYQTVYARTPGAIAAPTAGLHFTDPLLASIRDQGTAVLPVLLHVGPGTFAPVRVEDPALHRLEAEYYQVSPATADELGQRRSRGGRVVAVGTTAVRALETAAGDNGVVAGQGWSETFIYPPYRFKAVDCLVTNFHVPGSSLLFLVAAMVGRETLLDLYRQAIEARYRFYSYGDAMLIL
jgi:S-adenosylmethionine:tRNA ribosyltransferase-isomerase